MAKENKVVGQKKVRQNISLPADTAKTLKELPLAERKAFSKLLVEQGWTLKSVGDVLGITRQAVDINIKGKIDEQALAKASAIAIPPIPLEPIYKQVTKKIDPQTLAQLKELHAKAKLVRGRGKQYRDEAEQFTTLAWEQVQQGVSMYMVAKQLGITHGALMFRFVRYGYKTSKGKSKAYRTLTHRKKA